MTLLIFLTLLFSLNGFSQDAIGARAKLDTISGKYGFVNSSGEYIIEPQFDLAYNFMSEYTSVKVDTLWGIIDAKGKFYIQPKFESMISAVYRGHFIEYGKNMKFKNINNEIKLEYLFIPGPFKEINLAKDTLDHSKIEDYELIMRVLQMYSGRNCHYYDINRVFNLLAIGNEWVAKITIDFVLDNPEKTNTWIANDKEYEKAFDLGKIDCCGYGPVWYGE